MRQGSLPALERRLKRYTQVDLLILDQNGYLSLLWHTGLRRSSLVALQVDERATLIELLKKLGTSAGAQAAPRQLED